MHGGSLPKSGPWAADTTADAMMCEEIGRVLVGAGSVSAEAMREVLARHDPDPVRCAIELIDRYRLDRQAWTEAMAKVTGLEMGATPRSGELLAGSDNSVTDLERSGITRMWAVAHRAVPIHREGRSWIVMTAEARAGERRRCESALLEPVIWVAGDPHFVTSMIDLLWRSDRRISQLIAAADSDVRAGIGPDVVELVELVISQAVRDRASDLHIEPGREVSRIRMRVDGRLKDAAQLPLGAHTALVSRLKVMAQMDIVERRVPQDGTCATSVDGQHLDIRVASLPTVHGEKLVLRLLPAEMAVKSLGDLGMDSVTLARYRNVLNAHDGVILCAGPTGTGKTTSLFSSLATINDPTLNIVTIEDPVEYLLGGITQVQTNERAGLGFAQGLRAVLRQDPDIVLVGEIRDRETAAIATQAALTGHLVLSSVHGTDAVTSLFRLIDMGIAPYLVASSVRAVMAQRLIRLNCVSCARPSEPSAWEIDLFEAHCDGPVPHELWFGVGCEECRGTGSRGRSGVYELMVSSPAIRDLILGSAYAEQVRSQAISEGMVPMVSAAMALVSQGRSSMSEVVQMFHLPVQSGDRERRT
jgi:type IV pilus assembly protein PilB